MSWLLKEERVADQSYFLSDVWTIEGVVLLILDL